VTLTDTIGPDALRFLVDDPNETLSAEYKAQVDLETPLGRAKLARHIAALANHGGGHIVIGFDDNLEPASPRPQLPSRDTIARVVKDYLVPVFQCDVRLLDDPQGQSYAVVIVPTHGPTPVCCRADGPQNSSGKVQGINRGAYYIRKVGPESAPILTPEEWTPLIRRCAMAERSSILGAIELALRGGAAGPDAVSAMDRLENWDAAMAAAYLKGVAENGRPEIIAKSNYRFSYLIETSGELPSPNGLSDMLRRVANELDPEIHTGWGAFHVFDGPLTPRSKTDPQLDGGELEFLEMNLLEADSGVGLMDVWRVSATGLASIERGYIEDTTWWKGTPPGAAFSPNQMAMGIAEVVRHATLMAREFGFATQVHFRCEWRGLKGRSLHDFHHRWMFQGHEATDDVRKSRATATIGALEANWTEVAALLAGPVMRAFGVGHVVTPTWFSSQSTEWRRNR